MYCTRKTFTPLLLLSATLVSCSSLSHGPVEKSAEVDFVLANQGDFAISNMNPLASAELGDVIDNLNDLDGCWGEYSESDLEKSIIVYRISAVDGTYEWHGYIDRQFTADDIRAFYGDDIDFLQVLSGAFSVRDEDLIALTIEVETVQSSLFGDQVTDYVEDSLEPELPVADIFHTLSGDFLKIHWNETDSTVLKKFTCP